MLGQDRGEVTKVLILHLIPCLPQIVEGGLHVTGIPHGDDIDKQAQTGRPIQLAGEIVVRQYPVLPVGEVAREAVYCLSLVSIRPIRWR